MHVSMMLSLIVFIEGGYISMVAELLRKMILPGYYDLIWTELKDYIQRLLQAALK
jgi:hypothetical protein